MDIGFIGGGALAQALGSLLVNAGHTVQIGVRNPKGYDDARLQVSDINTAIRASKLVIIAVPFSAIDEVLSIHREALSSKIVIDATNPVDHNWQPIVHPDGLSAGERVAQLLPEARVVKAFNPIFADVMTPSTINRGGRKITLFIASDDGPAKVAVSELGADLGFDPIDAGPLLSARYTEAMAHLNIVLAVAQGGGTKAAYIYDRDLRERK
ncbi:NADPH-dependent F420 reductase [Rhizobium sp. Rhizsp82]|uniref:NADPH-dependent F420 reductase n=1 Tax=Rhizobium sp. Rhizsp82 TaxID=3243057 RepID=UPI0039B6018F